MENKRLKEIKLGIYLNHIDRTKDKMQYFRLVNVLASLASSFGDDIKEAFEEALKASICDGFINASNKEMVCCYRAYFSKMQIAKRLGITNAGFDYRYKGEISREFDKEFIDGLEPMLESEKASFMVDQLVNFIEKFKVPANNTIVKELDEKRTLELDFYLVYNKLFELYRNDAFITKFIYNMCNAFELDYSTINNLKNNIHLINRSFPNFRYNNPYFKQELYTLFTLRGYSKGTIGTEVFGRNASYLYNNAKLFGKVIPEEDRAWQYTSTLDWEGMDIMSVKKFIAILHEFVTYDV